MQGLEVVVLLGLAVLGSGLLSQRVRIAQPILLLAAGAVLGLIPALHVVSLPPEVVLLLFLPALLYWDSLTTSLRAIRTMLRAIALASTLLVIATAAAVAWAAHRLGMAWGPAWILGAAVAPTDATAMSALSHLLPHRQLTTLRAESLVNDGTALVVYGLAVGVTAGADTLSAVHVSGLFLLAYAGGAAAGWVTARLAVLARRGLDSPTMENVVSMLTPFVAFLLAELVHASGVLAVVVCGLILSQVGPRLVRADTRQQANSFWTLTTFVLNGALFVLVGLEVPNVVRGMSDDLLPRALIAVGVISGVVIGSRFVWMFTMPYLIRLVDRRPGQRLLRVGARARVVSASAGFRGAVSLAAALAVPPTLESGAPFPDRDEIIFVTTGVIVVTLVLQGLALPMIVRWAALPQDDKRERERVIAEMTATEEAMAALDSVADDLDIDPAVRERTRAEYRDHLRVLHSTAHANGVDHHGPGGDDEDEDEAQRAEEDALARAAEHYRTLRLELLTYKRSAVVRMRDQRQIDDSVLRQIQTRLDIEEVRLSRRETSE